MKIRLSDFWRWDGTVDRGPYTLIGVVLFAAKHNLDRIVASAVYNRPWSLFNYFTPADAVNVSTLDNDDAAFYRTILALAIPFIYVGVVLTLRRLRAAGLPLWLVSLFFVPVVNLVFFLVLALAPSKPADDAPGTPRRSGIASFLDRLIPDHPVGSAAISLLMTVPFTLLGTVLAVYAFGEYGWGLFVGLPFCSGLYSVLVYGYHRRRGFLSCLLVAGLSIVFLGLALAALAIEGAICLLMAAPLMLGLGALGGVIGWAIQSRPWASEQAPAMMALLVLVLPALMGAEYHNPPVAPLVAVTTAVEIDAPPEVVWQNVVSFSELPPPDDLFFATGIAYPLRAEIKGCGVGAVRHCIFSTGPFVEPITVWDEPRLLKFTVTSQPKAMREITVYPSADPPHLDDYLVSEGGQFLLTPLEGGRTRLEGTTWYRHNIWPANYWRVWSDLIIHRIHLRVLRHVEALSEG